ncbi:hypothetical protein B0J14DRAFT_582463 [Halenospora varia]|nr:hypothetical protein B0J14DRAFT_582463 [Halenospora varia]
MTSNPRNFHKQFITSQPQQVNTPPPPYQVYPSPCHYQTMATNNNTQSTSHLPLQGQITHPDADSDSEDDSESKLSEIHLSISTPLRITGDNNIISVDTATNASRISLAVVSALRQISATGGGVPMIDANGEPRPIRVDVMAEIMVEGSGNTVGERAVLSQVVDREALRRMESAGNAESAQIKVENGTGAQPLQKRGRGPAEHGQALGSESKRVRRD